jgi:hypothetical protein
MGMLSTRMLPGSTQRAQMPESVHCGCLQPLRTAQQVATKQRFSYELKTPTNPLNSGMSVCFLSVRYWD